MADLRARTLTRPTSHDEQDAAENWRDRAACKDEDPETFFDTDRMAQAVRICKGCAVIDICLQDALDTFDYNGVRGGRSGRARKQHVLGARSIENTAPAHAARIAQGRATAERVAELTRDGLNANEVAAEMGINRATVHGHLRLLRERGELPQRPPREIQHGTRYGYYAHQKRDEQPCDACLTGYRAHEQRRRDRARERAAS